jgi:hypothetical protein
MATRFPSSTQKILTGAACLVLGAAAFWLGSPLHARAASARVYELRTYHCMPGKLEALKSRFRDHTIKIFERHGMKSIGYWTPADAPASQDTLTYILQHESREAAQKSWTEFRADPEWIQVRDASEKDGKLVEKVDSTYMSATDFSPIK